MELFAFPDHRSHSIDDFDAFFNDRLHFRGNRLDNSQNQSSALEGLEEIEDIKYHQTEGTYFLEFFFEENHSACL